MSATAEQGKVTPKILFEALLKKERIGHAYLFEGPSGTGKKELAIWTAKAVLCLNPTVENQPCNQCINCTRIQTNNHPDVMQVKPDGQSIKVDQIRYLKSEFSKSGIESARKVFIIEDAHKMTTGAANSLLKFLEEPEGKVTAFLLTTAKNRLLPTILSRCQNIQFQSSSRSKRQQTLIEEGVLPSRAALFVQLTNDNEQALQWNEEEWYQDILPLISRWLVLLEKKDRQAFVFVQSELMPKLKEKEYQLIFLDILLLLYRELLHYQYSGELTEILSAYQVEINKNGFRHSGTELADVLTLVLEAKRKLERNVAIQGVLEQFSLERM